MIIDELATWLEDNGYGTVGTDIFKQFKPDTGNCIILYDTGGYAPAKEIPVDFYTVQVVVRNTDYSTAWTTANNIKNAWHMQDITLTSNVLHCEALSNPVQISLDTEEYYMVSVNFKFVISR